MKGGGIAAALAALFLAGGGGIITTPGGNTGLFIPSLSLPLPCQTRSRFNTWGSKTRVILITSQDIYQWSWSRSK